jgi:Flp pilus assembly protein TadG
LRRRGEHSSRGQALVEFALTFVLFILLVMGVVDFGHGVFVWNGVAEAARDIAREASVHPGTTLGDSPDVDAVVASHKDLLAGMADPTFQCVGIDGSAITGTCRPGDWVRVDVQASYAPVTPPLLYLVGQITLSSSSSIQITRPYEFP